MFFGPFLPSRVCKIANTHTIHVWYIYLHLVDVYGIHVGK